MLQNEAVRNTAKVTIYSESLNNSRPRTYKRIIFSEHIPIHFRNIFRNPKIVKNAGSKNKIGMPRYYLCYLLGGVRIQLSRSDNLNSEF